MRRLYEARHIPARHRLSAWLLAAVFSLSLCVQSAWAAPAASAERTVIPLGKAVGIKLFAAGVLVVGLADGDTPARTCGLRQGDIITAMDGTAIDYPILQGDTNFTYINTDVYGDFALAGSIFLDADCNGEFRDPYSLLYGHHMENSKMFGDVGLYQDAAFFAQNTTGELVTPDRTYRLETVACLLVPASETAIFDPRRWENDLQGLYRFVRENARNRNEETLAAMEAAGGGVQVLALSTCSTEYTDARTILLTWMHPSASDTERRE